MKRDCKESSEYCSDKNAWEFFARRQLALSKTYSRSKTLFPFTLRLLIICTTDNYYWCLRRQPLP